MAIDLQVGRGRGKGKARPQMNVTPLVDVVLVLLIIFMVVTPLMSKQFWVHMPDLDQEQQAAEPEPEELLEPIVVSVAQGGAVRINREVVPDEDFARRLRRMLAARQSRTIFFDAHDEVDFARAAQVLDLARGGGAATIAVLTEAIQ
jgi:biopolymer transport protein ExbD